MQDDEKAIVRILNVFMYIALAGSVLVVVAALLQQQGAFSSLALSGTVGLITCLLVLWLLRIGQFTIPRLLLPTIIYLLATYLIFTGTTVSVRDYAVLLYSLVVALAGLLLRRRGVIIYGTLSVVTVLYSVYAEIHGVIVNNFTTNTTTYATMVATGVTYGLTFAMMFILVSILTSSLARSRADQLGLKASREELKILNATLEDKVVERTAALDATRSELMEASKMAALGQLVAGISHELNTPIGAIDSSVRNLGIVVRQGIPSLLEKWRTFDEAQIAAFNKLIGIAFDSRRQYDSLNERKRRKAMIAHLAARGIDIPGALAGKLIELGAGGDLETIDEVFRLANPETVIESALKISTLAGLSDILVTSANKASAVIKSLRLYSRQDEGDAMSQIDPCEEIDNILTLFHNALKRGIEVLRDYAEVPLVLCRRDQINQVWINLVSNALHAMDYRGILAISIGIEGESLIVKVADSGHGIAPEHFSRIFSPFFTTKSKGEGTGLGLSISKRIVEENGGSIGFESGSRGTVFSVKIPIKPIDMTGRTLE
jgi:signal transduction histidine kinase